MQYEGLRGGPLLVVASAAKRWHLLDVDRVLVIPRIAYRDRKFRR